MIGKTLDEAKELKEAKSISIGNISERPDEAEENTVIEQNPNPNQGLNPMEPLI